MAIGQNVVGWGPNCFCAMPDREVDSGVPGLPDSGPASLGTDHSQLFRGHHPAQQSGASRGQSGGLDCADRAPSEIDVQVSIPGKEV